MVGTNRPQRDKSLLLAHATRPVCWLKALLGVLFIIFILTWGPRPAELPLSGGVPIGCGGAEDRVEKHYVLKAPAHERQSAFSFTVHRSKLVIRL